MSKHRENFKAQFVGRKEELQRFAQLEKKPGAKILIVYGRRRVGKTTLIQRAYQKRNLISFEGLEGKNQQAQRNHFMEQLAVHVNDTKLAKIQPRSWKEAFLILAEYIAKGVWTVHLEEIQWMANYREDLVSELKYVWDNFWSRNEKLVVILCGSSPSFLVDSVMHSKALHNRSQYEFPISELSFSEASALLGPGKEVTELLDGYLAVGGIPEYLKYLTNESSVYLSLARECFTKGGFFVHEAERVFISNLARKLEYRAIIEVLAKRGPTTKKILLKAIKYSSGGSAKRLFDDLEKCGFIYPYSPLSLGSESRNGKWMIADSYLQLYYRLIKSKLASIQRGEFSKQPSQALPHTEYRKWLGLAFERFCLLQHRAIAGILGFSGVSYAIGPYYQRNSSEGLQVDLVFERKDKVLTICEIKYLSAPPGKELIAPFERKLALLNNKKAYSIQKVLVSPNGANYSLIKEGYFDQIITFDQMSSVL